MTLDLRHRMKSITPVWWGAIAAAAAAGATIVPAHRVGAALVGGSAMLTLALWNAPCCSDCAAAAAKAAAASSPAPTAAPPAPTAARVETWAEDFGFGTVLNQGGCK